MQANGGRSNSTCYVLDSPEVALCMLPPHILTAGDASVAQAPWLA